MDFLSARTNKSGRCREVGFSGGSTYCSNNVIVSEPHSCMMSFDLKIDITYILLLCKMSLIQPQIRHACLLPCDNNP